MEAKLVVQAPGGQRHEFPLRTAVTAIGRSSGCDLVLDYDYVSRLHARIEGTEDGFIIIDCESTNGTFVSGRRVSGMQLMRSGDIMTLSDISITYLDAADEPTTATVFRPIATDCPIRCDSSTWEVWIGDKLVETRLSLREFELLSLLTSRYGKVCTRDELGKKAPSPRTSICAQETRPRRAWFFR